MIKRIVEISSECYVSMKNNQMIIDYSNERESASAPIEDLGVVVLDNKEITCTSSFLDLCAKMNVAVIVCDDRHLPSGLFFANSGNSLHGMYVNMQSNLSIPLKRKSGRVLFRERLKIRHLFYKILN